MEFIKVILTSILSIAAVFIITKIMGHKQVAQLDFFDYVSGITIGSIAAELATELESPWKPLTALVAYGIASVAFNVLTRRLPGTRKYINGTPTILMNNGKIYRSNLKKSKLDLSEFMLLCREMGYFDLDEIQTAVFEHNGKLSILPRTKNRPVTPEDLHLSVKQEHVGVELIMDGKIMGENLNRLGRDEKWLSGQLRAHGYNTEEQIFLGVYRGDDDTLLLYDMDSTK